MDYPTDTALNMHPSTGKFTNGDPVGGVPASVDDADVHNNIWDEIINVISVAGLTPDENTLTQLADAVAVLVAQGVSGKADSGHNHDSVYSPSGHNHDSVYSPSGHNHDSDYVKPNTNVTLGVVTATSFNSVG